jgi:glutathione S-transferase
MKLYYSPAAGSLASHITVRELNLDVALVRVDVQESHETESGADYYAIQPRGYVPFLAIDSDRSLSEGAAILLYLADQHPEQTMSAAEGTFKRYELQAWLTFIATEVQRILGSFFIRGHLTDAGREFAMSKLDQRLVVLDKRLADNEYLMGGDYTVADAYAFAILNWIPAYKLDVDLARHEHLSTYLHKIRNREAVQLAMREEGLQP